MLSEKITHLILIFGSTVSTFLLAFMLYPYLMRLLTHWNLRKRIRENGWKAVAENFRALHLHKEGTPTMGGILIWGTTIIVLLLSKLLAYLGYIDHSLINRKETYLPIFTLVTVALLGAVDDYFNIKGWGKSHGINVKPKIFWQITLALLGAWWFYYKLGYNSIHIPFMGDMTIGWWYMPLFVFIIVGSANAVNFTDGLDGLAGGLSIIALLALGGIAYVQGLLILTTFCGVMIGALLAFLWFNIPPAKFFMGDTGSMSIGATLGVIAMLTNSVVVYPLITSIFVIETLSVIIQQTSKKVRGKKVFHIAPIHHHFEHLGWPAHQVTMRFWIIGGFFASLGAILGIAQF